jgi:nucleotide-binding universal stress UspA family protein
VPISETIVTTAQERGSPAVVVGQRARRRLQEVFLSDTSRDVIRHAPCPSWSPATRTANATRHAGG